MTATIDAGTQLAAVERTVQRRERDGRAAVAMTLRQRLPATPEDLWDALTNGERIPRWFLPISGDLRPGGSFQLEGNAGGRILTCERPRELGVTWAYGDSAESWVTLTLAADGGGTTLTLDHEAIMDEAMEGMWARFGPGAVGIGWDMALFGLHLHLATGAANDAQAFMAWMGGEEGHAFVRTSSDAWARASIAAGTPEEAARAAAAGSLAFYTGETEPGG